MRKKRAFVELYFDFYISGTEANNLNGSDYTWCGVCFDLNGKEALAAWMYGIGFCENPDPDANWGLNPDYMGTVESDSSSSFHFVSNEDNYWDSNYDAGDYGD